MSVVSNSRANGIPRIFRLPGELRNQIYGYALTSDESIAFKTAYRDHPLSKTCRQLREETSLIYYRLNTFTLPVKSHAIESASLLVRRFKEHDCSRLNAMNKLQLVVDAQKTSVRSDQLRAAVEYQVMQELEGTRLQGDAVEFQWKRKEARTKRRYLEAVDRALLTFIRPSGSGL